MVHTVSNTDVSHDYVDTRNAHHMLSPVIKYDVCNIMNMTVSLVITDRTVTKYDPTIKYKHLSK